jgi:chromatin segregation and condensation protein Rec8/ScpA/Scc1 (kleisin family)
MENSFLVASGMQRSLAGSPAPHAPGRKREKVVMISSHRGWLHGHEASGEELAADTVHLVRVFHEVLERVRRAPVLNMEDESITVGQMIDQIWRRLGMEAAPVRLSQILHLARSERAVICLELALLELVRLQAILLRQDRNFSEILLKRNSALPGS